MASGTKIVAVTAVGVIVVVGGYIGAQFVVGSQVEKALTESFAELDRSPSVDVTEVAIDKGLFNTTASATVTLRGVPNAFFDVDMLVDHGILGADITGTIVPNDDLIQGVIDIDLTATRDTLKGQLTASALQAVEADATLNDLVVDLHRDGSNTWRIDGVAHDIVINDDDARVHIHTPSVGYTTEGEETYVTQQRLAIPRIEILAQGMNLYIDGIESAAESTGDAPLLDQTGYFRIADIGADDTSFGNLSFDLAATNWDMQALQSFQEAYTPLEQMRVAEELPEEERGESVDEATKRELMVQAIESGYDFLTANPTVALDPLEARVTAPMFGLDFAPRLTADVRFDGEDLSRVALYSATWDRSLALPEALEGETITQDEAREDVLGRLYVDVSMTTPPDLLIGLIPMPFAALIDPEQEEQHLVWEAGSLRFNGEPLM
ncbi:YdgA family protein [Halomonas dongshanensis]|uniref:YdgA family protein n=1 Tax=Halomonas dongshanensis TaxID=2890835 RepID=A0ABT2EGA1_9GAMM|nr:YdgA family protein [Halomonas dongshanensis]MCS2610145.1 YdgA family protein [Halomonas dongshanensis]